MVKFLTAKKIGPVTSEAQEDFIQNISYKTKNAPQLSGAFKKSCTKIT